MSARDELADLLADILYRHTGVSTSSSKEMAQELLDAGYGNRWMVASQVTALREAAYDTRARGDIGKEGGVEAWDYLHWRADRILTGDDTHEGQDAV